VEIDSETIEFCESSGFVQKFEEVAKTENTVESLQALVHLISILNDHGGSRVCDEVLKGLETEFVELELYRSAVSAKKDMQQFEKAVKQRFRPLDQQP
jgi:hypothetical protein